MDNIKNMYRDYIGDLHLNLHPDQLDLLPKWYEFCKKKVDFFTLAYYPYTMKKMDCGFDYEIELNDNEYVSQWETIRKFLLEENKKDDFVTFIGFEWQGTGEDGDHNVYFKGLENAMISLPKRYNELKNIYENQSVIAIPHHLAYSLGNRGKNWDTHDEHFSPYVETYSHHGSSEGENTNLAMNRHIHMGPRVDNTSVIQGLKQGYHFGIIASGDNHEVPAMVKNGRAGVWAKEYSSEGLWEAMINRRVYGFTDSKISTWIECDGHPMGSVFGTTNSSSCLKVYAVANGKINRIELYKNGELDEIKLVRKCKIPNSGRVRMKFKLEYGWGPNVKYFPEESIKTWKGLVSTDADIMSVETIYSSFENDYTLVDAHHLSFKGESQKLSGTHWMRDSSMRTEGIIIELYGDIDSVVEININNQIRKTTIDELIKHGDLIVYEDDAKKLLENRTGLTHFYRSDAWYHNAYKAKIYQGVLSEEYMIEESFVLTNSNQEDSYFVKIIQDDGQVAWSSPIWIRKAT